MTISQPNPWNFEFCATVGSEHRDAVEALFFFNERQPLLIEHIRRTIEKTGTPLIVESDDRIRLDLPTVHSQCLFACDRDAAPVAVALYCRPTLDLLWVQHLAVNPGLALAESGESGLGLLLIDKIREIARHIRGVTRLQLPYRNRFLRVRSYLCGGAKRVTEP